MNSLKDRLIALFIKILGFPLSFLSYRTIHLSGKILGKCAFYLDRHHRKQTINNLAIAYKLKLTEKQMRRIAKESFENLAITVLEFFRIRNSRSKLEEIIICENPEAHEKAAKHGKGVILLSCHQANWETPFIEISSRQAGTAVGRPIKNRYLYKWILSFREMNGGKIITPKKAISMGIKELKKGRFLGIVGDQSLPESSYSFPFFGVRAWTSPSPALLSYKTGAPLLIISNQRREGKYYFRYSDPIWPNRQIPLKQEVPQMMDRALKLVEKSIKDSPGQYFWQHKRWKQSGVNHIRKKYRHDFILLILPKEEEALEEILPHLLSLREIYPRGFFSFLAPEKCKGKPLPIKNAEIFYYKTREDLFIRDWRQQMIFDFIDDPSIRRHFRKLGAFHTFHREKLQKLAKKHPLYKKGLNLSMMMRYALLKIDF